MATKLLLSNAGRWSVRRWNRTTFAVPFLPAPVRNNSQHRIVLIPEVPDDTDKTNPVMKKVTDGLPEFASVTCRHVYFGLGKTVMEFEAVTDAMEQKCKAGERNFKELFADVEKVRCQLESVWNSANLLQLVTDGMEKDRFAKLHFRSERAMFCLLNSPVIHGALKEMKAQKGALTQDEDQIVDRYLLDYRQAGFELDGGKREELTGNFVRQLSGAVTEYKFRIETSTEKFRHTIRDPNVVREFPIDVLKAMASDSSQPTKGPWMVTLHPYIYKQVMAWCPDRNIRWKTYLGAATRGSKSDDGYTDVAPQVKLIRQHRNDQALTVGYEHFAEMSMTTKMAATVDNVHTMISSMLETAKSHQEAELEALQAFAETRGFDDDIEVFDVDFFTHKQKRALLGVSDEDLRDYLPFPKVLSGIFQLFSSLFCVHFEEVKLNESLAWHPDVRLFRAIDTSPGSNNVVLGEFYLDPYIRDDKGYGGGDKGWYVPIRPFSAANCSPLGAMILSLPAPNYGKPSLLNFAETQEVLRNFGNVLFHLCSRRSDWSNASYKTGLEWDVVDLPAFFVTNWLSVPEVVRLLSGHWSTNQPLDAEVVSKLCSVPRRVMAGYSLCQELFDAAYDIAFYENDPKLESYQDLAIRLRAEYLLLPAVEGDAYPLYHSNMMSGFFPAAVFTSTWAKMLAADAFSAVQEVMPDPSSSILTSEEVKKVTMRFRSTVLQTGSSRPSAETFRRFRGRDPSQEALLMSLGLKAKSSSGI